MSKRIVNEISRSQSITSEHFNQGTRILTFIYKNEKGISLKIPDEYPFRPPKELKVNFIPINYYSLGNKEMLYKYLTKKCLCCSTILCKHNWSVQKNLENVCEEYIFFKDIINASIVFNYIEKKDLLPNEIIKIIGKFFKLPD
tara:strand:- start:221 stop:649 length:429 start_codon:yes stop_codon:yes gene_type:complete